MSHNTMGLTAHGTWKFKTPMSEGIHHAMNPDPYKGLFGGKHCRDSPVQVMRDCSCQPGSCMAAGAYMEQFEEVVKYSLPKGISNFLTIGNFTRKIKIVIACSHYLFFLIFHFKAQVWQHFSLNRYRVLVALYNFPKGL